MSEFTVTINSRSAGLVFGVGKRQHFIAAVAPDSLASSLGLCVGDELVSMNDISILYPLQMIESGQFGFDSIACIWSNQQLPFTATFKHASASTHHSGSATQVPTLNTQQFSRRQRTKKRPTRKAPSYSTRSKHQETTNAKSTLVLD